jgi:crotonobetainyl-CoA:carnitine CoA-transferase CaiB-like acyl-CoA transferase
LNRGKRALVLDLKNKENILLLKELVKKADVVIDAYRPGVLENLGLGFEVLKNLNKGIILARVSGFGQSGPFSKLAGHDINYLSYSGVMDKFVNK